MEDKGLILVTGASGFAAGWIVKQLLEDGHRVRGTVRSLKSEEKIQHLIALGKANEDRLELVEADLLDPLEKWEPVVQGCTYVCHTASPFPIAVPDDEQELIKPAVSGTLVVLEASSKCGVKRVVLTSSVASIFGGWDNLDNKTFTEEDWAIEAGCVPYQKSKLLAEKAAWDFVNKLSPENKIELVALCPSLIAGPLLSKHGGDSSHSVLIRFLNGSMPGVPNLWLNVIDVRDLARCHIAALWNEKAAGNRYICSSSGLWMKDIANILSEEFSSKGYKITTTSVPNFLLWVVSIWDKDAAGIYPRLDKKQVLSNTKITTDLELSFSTAKESILAMAHSLIEFGKVNSTQ